MFGSTFVSQYGNTPLVTWVQAIATLTDEEIFNGLHAVAMSGDTFPPTLPKFVVLCRGSHQEPHAGMYKQLPSSPPETKEHRDARLERGRQRVEEIKAKLKGKA